VCMVNRDTGVLRVEGAHCAFTRSKKAGVCIVEGVEFVDTVRYDASAPIAKRTPIKSTKKNTPWKCDVSGSS
jgi:hypothetical protein